MSSWARRINRSGKQYRCGNCWGVIDVDEEYFQILSRACKLCIECEPDDDEAECSL